MSIVGFQMWEPFRQQVIAEHRFYLEQARKRLMSQFQGMEADADQAAEDHLEKMASCFNPDIHDPSDFYESAQDRGVEFFQLLEGMREHTRLSIVAGLYHTWEKNLKTWIVGEIRHWNNSSQAQKEIWRADLKKLTEFLSSIGFDATTLAGHSEFKAMRSVVNVFKHGNGDSFEELLKSYPELLANPLGDDCEVGRSFFYVDHTYLRVADDRIDRFSEAIVEFWSSLPKEVLLDGLVFPNWFAKALHKNEGIK